MRRLTFIIVILVTLVSAAGGVYGQACGSSVRTIKLEYPAGAKPAAIVTYQLFYVAPKNDANTDWAKRLEFVSNFYYGDPKAKELPFWPAYGDGTQFLDVPAAKALAYLKGYKVSDYQKIYSQDWNSGHLPQLKGKFTEGQLELKTSEGDATAFLMKVTARGYKTQYLLSNFLGGCFPKKGDPNVAEEAQKIVMKK